MKISLNRIINQSNLDYVITGIVDLKTNINIYFKEILNKLLETDKVYLRSVDYEIRDLKKYCNEVYEKINKEINCKSEMGIFFEYRLAPQRKLEFNDNFNKVLILNKIDETSNDKKSIYLSDFYLEISIKNSFERLFSCSKKNLKII
ncbi:hypothetical protein H312_02354 [Anncaliia algerae PRA339]|uniref:Uncharacterized protein n=1 Tax=Anncaliia algerae PRA339 TaxID=1288291 RepID=A0A059EZU1_9MICR|nr:hypothetical protein H312_02354 [Anncaliia algerae PRA339]